GGAFDGLPLGGADVTGVVDGARGHGSRDARAARHLVQRGPTGRLRALARAPLHMLGGTCLGDRLGHAREPTASVPGIDLGVARGHTVVDDTGYTLEALTVGSERATSPVPMTTEDAHDLHPTLAPVRRCGCQERA